jgi:hypothetical protein
VSTRACECECHSSRARVCGSSNSPAPRPAAVASARVRAQGMSVDGIGFTIAARGSVVDVATVSHGSPTPDGRWPWALLSISIADLLTPAGIAWMEFVLGEGDGSVAALVAHKALNRAAGVRTMERHGVWCDMRDGEVFLDRAIVRARTGGWGARWASGERMRPVYVDATRMASVVWRGASIDLVPLPAAHAIAATRFGIAVGGGNTVRITGMSGGGAPCVDVVHAYGGCICCR